MVPRWLPLIPLQFGPQLFLSCQLLLLQSYWLLLLKEYINYLLFWLFCLKLSFYAYIRYLCGRLCVPVKCGIAYFLYIEQHQCHHQYSKVDRALYGYIQMSQISPPNTLILCFPWKYGVNLLNKPISSILHKNSCTISSATLQHVNTFSHCITLTRVLFPQLSLTKIQK